MLNYEITEKGYRIYQDGKLWIVQEQYFPYAGDTMDEKATAHLKALEGILSPYDEIQETKYQTEISYNSFGSFYSAQSLSLKEKLPEEAGYFYKKYPEWKAGEKYEGGQLLQYENCAVQVRQSVTAQEHQPPFSVGMTAIYIPYLVPDENGVKTYKYGCSTKRGELFYDENRVVFEHIAVDNPSNIYPPSEDLPAIWKKRV